MKTRIMVGILSIVVFLSMTTSVFAAGFGLSPSKVVEFDVPASGSTIQEFTIYDFNGELEVSLEDIPLRVEPQTIQIDQVGAEGEVIELIFYGDESLGDQVFEGKVRFLPKTTDAIATGIKVKAIVHQVGSSQESSSQPEQLPEQLAEPEEAVSPTELSEETVSPLESFLSSSWVLLAMIVLKVLTVILLLVVVILLVKEVWL